MRWIDKPMKKTRKEVVLEYIKFVKIMGYYSELVSYMYDIAQEKQSYVYLNYGKTSYADFGLKNYYRIDTVSHNKGMIEYFVTEIMNHCRNNRITEYFVKEYLIVRPLRCHTFGEIWDLTALLMSYFKEKHIDNCILID